MPHGSKSDLQYMRIRDALDPFALLTKTQKDKAAASITKSVKHFKIAQDITVSRFLDFHTKVAESVRRFAPEKLTLKAYLRAARLNSKLFYQDPATLEDNIRGLVTCFAGEGLTPQACLDAALHNPTMFSQDPKKMESNIRGVVARFEAEGLTVESYLKAALRTPSLFSYSPSRVESNIRRTVKRFEAEGLTAETYVTKAVLKQPELACMKPQRIAANIRGAVRLLKKDGLTVEAYLPAALRQPQLFCRPPKAVKEAFQRFFQLSDDGILTVPDAKEDAPPSPERKKIIVSPHQQVIALLTQNPYYLCLGADNIMQRQVAALISGKKLNMTLMKAPKPKIAEMLDNYVSRLDHPLPNLTETTADVPSTRIDASSAAYGEMLLVRMAKRGALQKDLSDKVLSQVGIAA